MEVPLNEFLIGVQGDEITILRPPMRPMSKLQALGLAAWLVTLADDDETGDTFGAMLEAAQNS